MILERNNKGFTLIELMVVIGVIAILSAVGIPSIMGAMSNYRIKAAARDLVSNFQRAKLEAMKRNTNIAMVFTTGAYDVGGEVGGYRVFVDDGVGGGTAGDGIRNGSETYLTTMRMPKNVSLLDNETFGGGTGFNSRGLPAALGNIQMQNNNSRYYRITLSMVGNIRLQMSSNGIVWN